MIFPQMQGGHVEMAVRIAEQFKADILAEM